MDIISYLLELIESRKTVGVTALGTFYKKKIPGRYDSESHTFLPPRHEIAFTNEVQGDEELARFISEKRNISVDAAHFYINEFVDSIQSHLAEHQLALIAPLGELKLENNQLVFFPSSGEFAGFDFYGLPKVDAGIAESAVQPVDEESAAPVPVPQEIHAEEPEPVEQIEQDDQPVQEEISEAPVHVPMVENIPVQENENTLPDNSNPVQETEAIWKPTVNQRYEYGYDEDDDDDDNRKGRVKRVILKIVWSIIIIAVLGGILYLFFPALFDGLIHRFKSDTDLPQHINNGTGPAVMADTLLHQTDSGMVDSTAKVTLTPHTADSVLRQNTQTSPVIYEIIGGAMKTRKKADEVIREFAGRGIPAKKAENLPGRRIKISLGTFTDYDLAKKKLDSLKKKLKNPEIYIQTIKPQH